MPSKFKDNKVCWMKIIFHFLHLNQLMKNSHELNKREFRVGRKAECALRVDIASCLTIENIDRTHNT